MDIGVSIGKESLDVNILNPHKVDLDKVMKNIVEFGSRLEIDLTGLKIEKLIPKMIRGVAGCEGGCPADAKGLVRQGFGGFSLSYIEGGILSAVCTLDNGQPFSVNIFPEFN
ncbi:MAG TPA: hypothetical protein ENG95_04270 [Nitrospirae bacterium]|nr:hypothetical protein BMS3Abin10_00745 [bacterium BMS3Abin10]GBE38851.1 hypothetical protein BMS3Bbin08_01464 [bacterium BMS3Bbin08]HDO25839.1 hypothetical protein [Nitrospirota bacterium]